MFGLGNTHNVDMNRLDSQQEYIYNRAWNDAIETVLKLSNVDEYAAKQIRKLKK